MATITKGGETYTVCWPTGVPAQIVSLGIVINKHTQADAAAKAINPRGTKPTQPAGMPALPQETTMARLAKPALPRTESDTTSESPAKNPGYSAKSGQGRLQLSIISALMDASQDDPMTALQVGQLCPEAGSYDSLSTTLRDLARRGQVKVVSQIINGKRCNLYYLADAGHFADAGKMVEEPRVKKEDWEADTKPLPAPEGWGTVSATSAFAAAATVDPTEPCNGPAVPVGPVKNQPYPVTNPAHFAYYSDGAVEIFQDDETIMLPPAQVHRLVAFLDRINL